MSIWNLVENIAPQLRLNRAASTGNYNLPDGPPVYRIKLKAFNEFLCDYQRHVEALEAYFKDGRSEKVIAKIKRVEFEKRYGKVWRHLITTVQRMGQVQPFLNPIYFQHPKESRGLFWKLSELAAREWRVKSASGEGRPPGPDEETLSVYKAAREEYKAIARSAPHDTHRARCREVWGRLRRMNRYSPTAKTLERVLRDLSHL